MTQLALFQDAYLKVSESSQSFFDHLDMANESGWPDVFGEKCRQWSQSLSQKNIKTLSLFSGAGGLDIGFHDAGFSIQTCIEIEKKYANTLIENSGTRRYFGEKYQILCDDIRNYDPETGANIDFMIGGPPCQTFSAAGRRASGVMGLDDSRGRLFEEYIRLLKQLQPQGFLFENVYGITGAQHGKAWEKIQESFAAAGYRIFYRILDAADYGVPQFRERLFIIGLRHGEYLFPRPTHGPESPHRIPYFTAGEAIRTVGATKEPLSVGISGRYGHLLNDIPPGLNYSFYTKEMGHPNPLFAWRSKFSDFLYKADPEEPVRTLKAQGGQYTGPFHWDNRTFTIAELKRLQTFPDQYSIVGTRLVAIQQLGNSVPPQLARILALSVLHQIFGVDLPFDMPLLQSYESLSFRKRKAQKTHHYREKATHAISLLEKKEQICYTQKKNIRFQLHHDFEIVESSHGHWVEIASNEQELRIQVLADGSSEHHFTIEITPVKSQGWDLPYLRVVLQAHTLTPELYVMVWKIFEYELVQSGKKADLVQLHGYYQYSPSFQAKMNVCGSSATDPRWAVVASVVSGMFCRHNHSHIALASAWNVPPEKILDVALFLRKIGYEVRNSKTNPQVPENHYLIPYPFPTLNRLSVQLRKSLL